MQANKPVVAVGAVIIKEDKLLLVQRGEEPAKGLWAIPGGKVNFGETLQAAVEREIREETGLIIKAGKPVCIAEIKAINATNPYHYIVIDMICQLQGGHIDASSDVVQAEWFNRGDIVNLELQRQTREFIERWWLNGEAEFITIE